MAQQQQQHASSSGKACVFGGGAFGTALSFMLAKNGYSVTLWHPNAKQCDDANAAGENLHGLKGAKFPKHADGTCPLHFTSDFDQATSGSPAIAVFAVPMQRLRKFVNDRRAKMRAVLESSAFVVIACKGIERGTLALAFEVLEQSIADAKLVRSRAVVLAGPSFARELAEEKMTSFTVAAYDAALARKAQRMLSTKDGQFRGYATTDVEACEVSSAVKNVVAIAAGMTDGLGLGRNARAAMITQGLYEIAALSRAHGGVFGGVMTMGGVGDVMLTASSKMSRNFQVGRELAQGVDLKAARKNRNAVSEGVPTCEAVVELGRKLKVELPLCDAVYRVLKGDLDAREAIDTIRRPALHPLCDEPLNPCVASKL